MFGAKRRRLSIEKGEVSMSMAVGDVSKSSVDIGRVATPVTAERSSSRGEKHSEWQDME